MLRCGVCRGAVRLATGLAVVFLWVWVGAGHSWASMGSRSMGGFRAFIASVMCRMMH